MRKPTSRLSSETVDAKTIRIGRFSPLPNEINTPSEFAAVVPVFLDNVIEHSAKTKRRQK